MLNKVWYYVEVYGYDRKKVLQEVVDDHVVEEKNDPDEIGLQGFNFLTKTMRGVIREVLSEYTYL